MAFGRSEFASELKALGINVSRETLQRLETYAGLLVKWQAKINLVGPATLPDLWRRHFLDSAQLLPLLPAAIGTLADLGSGAGFPGLVIAILLAGRNSPPPRGEGLGVGGSPTTSVLRSPPPQPSPARGEEATPRVTLIESDSRKCAFLREVARETGVTVEILSTRIELPATQAKLDSPEVVSARALAPLDRLLGLAAPLFTPATVGVFLKGRDATAEIETAAKAWTFAVEMIPSLTEASGRVVVVRNLQPKSKD